jgi:hypothetical protein
MLVPQAVSHKRHASAVMQLPYYKNLKVKSVRREIFLLGILFVKKESTAAAL